MSQMKPQSTTDQAMLKHSRWVGALIVVLIFVLGLLLRLTDLDDPPLGFNPTRQLRSAIIARGMYYTAQKEADPLQRHQALTHWKMMERLEPSVLESMVAATYGLVGEELVWVARVYTSIFWLIGAAALYDIARRMTSALAALFGLGYFMFLPFSILASRSFQPDPGMIMLVLLTGWALFRWSEARTWRWAILAGILGGAAALVKVMAAFFIGGMAIGIVTFSFGPLSDAQNDKEKRWRFTNLEFSLGNLQIWAMAALMVAPALIYYLVGSGEQSSSFIVNWTILSRWREVLTPSFFMRWLIRVSSLMEPSVVLAAFVGTFLVSRRSRALLWGFWGGYFLYGLMFPHHITTHDYYHLPLLAVVSLSLPALATGVIDVVKRSGIFVRTLFVMVVLVAAVYNAWLGRSILVGQDFSDHPAYWSEVGELVAPDAKLVGVTQDYGFRMMYYGWRTIHVWPQGAGSEIFDQRASDADYFVVTAENQMNDELNDFLNANYPVYAEGVGYRIYNLTH